MPHHGPYRQPIAGAAHDADAEQAVRVAARAAWRYGVTTGAFRRCVTAVRVEQEQYARALHTIERRWIALKTMPAPGLRKPQLAPVPDVRSRDPWSVDVGALEDESKCVCVCPTCNGDKRVHCSECGGTNLVRCHYCGGGGMVAGQRGPKNCPRCRGRGTRACDGCRSGKVDCPSCERAGRVHAWLGLQSTVWHQVKVSGPAAARLHPAVEDATDFARPPSEFPTRLVDDRSAAASELAAPLHPQLDPWVDRLRETRVQSFAAEIHHVEFETVFGRGVFDVAGRTRQLLPSSNARPLIWRVGALIATVAASAIVLPMLVLGYAAQGRWYVFHGSTGTVTLLSFLTGALALWCAYAWTLGRKARTLLRAVPPAALLTAAPVGVRRSSAQPTRPAPGPALEGMLQQKMAARSVTAS